VKGLAAGEAVLAKTPVEDDLREDDICVAPFSHPDQQVGVLSRPEARVVPVDSDEGVASEHRGTSDRDTGEIAIHGVAREPVWSVEPFLASEHRVDFRVVDEVSRLQPESAGRHQVIRVGDGDEIALRGRDARVSRGTGTAVFLPDVADIVKRLDHVSGVVRRAVVHDDDLIRTPILAAEYALERLADVARGVVGGDDDADKWMGVRGAHRCVRSFSGNGPEDQPERPD